MKKTVLSFLAVSVATSIGYSAGLIQAEVYCVDNQTNSKIEYVLVAGKSAQEKVLLVSESKNGIRNSIISKALNTLVNDQYIYALASKDLADRTQISFSKTAGVVTTGSFGILQNDVYAAYSVNVNCSENVAVQF